MAEKLYRFIKASERLPEIGERKHLRLCGEYLWAGRFILSDNGEEIYCDVDGQNKVLYKDEFSEIEWLCEIEADQDELWDKIAQRMYHEDYDEEWLKNNFILTPK